MELLKGNFIFLFFFVASGTISCHSDTVKRDIRKKPASGYSDSLYIDTRSVIFFEPDSPQMEEIKAVNEKMVFEGLTHDCFYQMRNARQVIEKNWPGLRMKLASKNRWLVFRKTNGADSVVDLDQVNDICGIFLFDPSRNPVRINMTNIDSELGFYFSRK